MKKLFIFLAFIISSPVLANEHTHQLGNSGYAIREAMHEGAATKSPVKYWEALRLQNEAKEKFKQRYFNEAMELSKQAYTLAKEAYQESK